MRIRVRRRLANPAFALVATLAFAQPLVGQQAAADGTLSVTLDEAIALALEHSPEMTQATGSVSTARAGERTARGAYLPTLSLSSGGSLSGGEQRLSQGGGTVSRSSDSYSLNLSTGVDVYTGGRRGAQQTQARAATASAGAALVEREYSVVLQTKRSFFDVLRATELLKVDEARVERAEQSLLVATDRERVGSATRSDVLRSQLELTRARQSVLERENQYNTAAYTLGSLLGSDGPVGAIAADALAITSLAVSPQELVQAAVSTAPSIVAAQATVRSNEAGIDLARAQYLPSVRLSSGYGFANQDPALWNGLSNWNVGFNVSFPILNGFQREESVERARVQTAVAVAQLNDAERSARANAERLLGNLRLAEQKIGMAGESVLVAQEDLRVQQDRYRLGASTILDQIQSQESLVQAETDLVTARYDYQIARAELESLLGREL
jgi:outer membrane protein